MGKAGRAKCNRDRTTRPLHSTPQRQASVCPDRWILRDITWEVPAGACAAILGPNGSGKSTLTKVIAGHLWPSAGDVRVLGEHFGEVDLHALRRGLRLVSSTSPVELDPDLTAHEVAMTGFFGTLGLYDEVDAPMRDAAAEILDRVGLHPVADHRYSTLSSGERMRCLIARALVIRPRLLMLDEPTMGLDFLAREQVLAAVQSLSTADADERPTVLMITHHLEELPPLVSHVLLLSEGQRGRHWHARSGAEAGSFISSLPLSDAGDALGRPILCPRASGFMGGHFATRAVWVTRAERVSLIVRGGGASKPSQSVHWI